MQNELHLSQIPLKGGNAPWLSLEAQTSNSQSIHISAANGFRAASYVHFLKQFNGRYSFTGMDCRGSWPKPPTPKPDFNMHDFANDLIEALDQQYDQPVIGLGHSQGGLVTLIAAVQRPDLFSKIILIEPASLPYSWIDRVYPHIPKSILYKLFPFMHGSLNRQRIWSTKKAFYDRYRQHNTYHRFTEQSFNDYMNHGLIKTDAGWELAFSPEWEAHIFQKVEFIWKYLAKVQVPTLFIKAEYSNLYSHQTFQKQNLKLSSENVTNIEITDTYHLLPLENPEKCIEIIDNWLA